jgi:hypothetical protein
MEGPVRALTAEQHHARIDACLRKKGVAPDEGAATHMRRLEMSSAEWYAWVKEARL